MITGGANGLGLCIAKRLADAGTAITIVDLPANGGAIADNCRMREINLAEDDAATKLASLAASLGTLDVLVANAGVVPPWRGIAEPDLEEWDRVMRINVWAVAATIGALSDALGRSGHGSLIAMALLNGHKAHPRQVL